MTVSRGVDAVDRAIKILDCFDAERHSLSLAELSKVSGLYKSTILRLTVSLERGGYLVRADSGHFRLGPTTWRLGSHYRQRLDLADVIQPELRRLCEATNETASFYLREGAMRVCLYRVEPTRSIKHSIDEGASMPLERGASGRVLLAFSEDQNERDLSIQADGYVVSMGERDPEVAAAAVPLFARSGRLVGALSVSGLITRFGQTDQAEIVKALLDSQRRLVDLLIT